MYSELVFGLDEPVQDALIHENMMHIILVHLYILCALVYFLICTVNIFFCLLVKNKKMLHIILNKLQSEFEKTWALRA